MKLLEIIIYAIEFWLMGCLSMTFDIKRHYTYSILENDKKSVKHQTFGR